MLRVSVYLTDIGLYGTFNEVYASYFDGNYPVRAFIGSGPLLLGCRFEMLGTAVRGR